MVYGFVKCTTKEISEHDSGSVRSGIADPCLPIPFLIFYCACLKVSIVDLRTILYLAEFYFEVLELSGKLYFSPYEKYVSNLPANLTFFYCWN